MRRMRLLVGNGVRQPNFQAIGVAFATMVAVNLNTDPLPAGSEPLALSEAAVEIPMTVTPTLITPKVNLTNPAPLADGLEPKGRSFSRSPPRPKPTSRPMAPCPMQPPPLQRPRGIS